MLPRVSETTRLWLIRSSRSVREEIVELCRSSGARVVLSDPVERSIRGAADLARRLGLESRSLPALTPRRPSEPPEAFELRIRAELSRIASDHRSSSAILVVAGPSVRCALQLALDLPFHTSAAIRPPPSSLSDVDWPCDASVRPALISVDLDWSPPPPVTGSKFPGGPGSAPSSR
jgi:hypothetical protein